MNRRNRKWLWIGGLIAVMAALIAWWGYALAQPGKYDGFAACLKEKGAEFYGAFWCPHCKEQKAMFGKSVKYLPYIECSTPNGQGQKTECQEKGVSGYPTWFFADGSRQQGVLSFQDLAAKTSCTLPK